MRVHGADRQGLQDRQSPVDLFGVSMARDGVALSAQSIAQYLAGGIGRAPSGWVHLGATS